jgi:hypothetical protein
MAALTEHQTALLEKALAGTLMADERREFESLLNKNPDVRTEWESLKSLQEVTTRMNFRKPPEETWDRYWAGVYARLERGFAWLLVSVGGTILLALAGYEAITAFLRDSQIPTLTKVAIGAFVLGVAILLVSIAREKWTMRKSDKYKEVVR